MDLKLQRPLAACARTNRAFVSGETFYSALVRAEGRLQRIDCAADAWQGPPPQVLAWWRSVYPAAESTGSTLAPPDVLLDVLERLEERPEDASLRYLVALQLVRPPQQGGDQRVASAHVPPVAGGGGGAAGWLWGAAGGLQTFSHTGC